MTAISRVTIPTESAAAELIARDGREARIAWDGAVCPATIAFGCLIQPEPGDLVLTWPAGDTIWIVSVLERRSEEPARLCCDRDLEAVSVHGSISITAGATIRVAAPEIALHAGIARFMLDELVHIGRAVSWFVDRLRSLGDAVETFAEHVLTHAKRSTRFIEESDQMRAGDIDHCAERRLQLQSEVAFISADTVVRMDAEQIHMG